MARSNKILVFRGTRASLNTLASANGLFVGELYYITDEQRLAVGTSTNTYQAFLKQSEITAINLGVSGKPAASQRLVTSSPSSFTISQANSSAKALVAATASTVFTIKKGTIASPTTIGTMTFAASGTTATVSITTGSITTGDMIWIECPATADATLADISFTLRP